MSPQEQHLLDDFEDALDDLDGDDRHGFGSGDIDRVEAYWRLLERDARRLGFVARLLDGRRAYLMWVYNRLSEDGPLGIEVEMLDGGDALPDGPDLMNPTAGWSSEVELLNDFLRAAPDT
jgi:hypothetical protein